MGLSNLVDLINLVRITAGSGATAATSGGKALTTFSVRNTMHLILTLREM